MSGEIKSPDPRERRRSRFVHWIGSAIFGLILLAALAGLVGKGPLSKAVAASADGRLRAEYFRFIHYEGPAELKIHIGSDATGEGMVRLRLSKAFVAQAEIQRIDPQPESEAAGGEFVTYTILAETNAPADVRVRFSATHFGPLAYRVGLVDGPLVLLKHFAFP